MNIAFFIYFAFVIILSCFHKYIWASVLSIAAVVNISILYTRLSSTISPFVITVLISIFFLCFIYLLRLYNKSQKLEIDNINGDFQKQEEQLSILMDKDKTLKGRNIQLEQNLNEIVTIYEYVKKLGSTMEFGEAISILKDTLTSLLNFSRGKLILIEGGNIPKIYPLSHDKESSKDSYMPNLPLTKGNASSGLIEYEKNIAFQILKNPHTLFYEKAKLTPLGELPKDIETLLAIPLLVEKQLVGIITFENIPLKNIDKIHFVALQFAMEVKKTQLYEKVKELSTIDSLTQLYLRRHFINLFANELDRGYRQNQPLSFLMADVDYFKRYNDEYGHLVGDLILKKIAVIIRERSREIDLLCRYGGDEYALALPRTAIKDAQIVAERLRRAVNEYLFQIANEQFQVAISIGVSSCNPKDMRLSGILDTLIDLADKALYKAKSQGRNRVVLAI